MPDGINRPDSVRLLIVQEDRLCREAIRQLCLDAGDIDVVGDLAVQQEAIQAASALAPDVILFSAGWKWIETVDAAKTIHAQHPRIQIIFLIHTIYEPLIHHMREVGIAGCLTKNAHPRDLLNAIRSAARGEPILQTTFEQNAPPAKHDGLLKLTPGEALVLGLVAHGEDNRTIAHQLQISEQTVANRLLVVYEKLGVKNRVQATLIAIKHGWVSIEE